MTASALPRPPPSLPLAGTALFLDVDGTLVEIEREPAAVKVPERLRQVLAELIAGTEGATALISGRSIEQLDALFRPLDFSASGLHGLERRLLPQGVVRATPSLDALGLARERLAAFAASHQGVFAEDKGLTLALHYRNGPQHHEAASLMVQGLVAECRGDLVLLDGKMVFELKPPGYDKGKAIAAFMLEPPFRGRRPLFAGDDVTDEAGFEAIKAMDGISIKVGVDGRPTAAAHGQPDVSEMQRWLARIAGVESAS